MGKILAGGSSSDRQRDPTFSCRLLARFSNGGGGAIAEANLRARLVAVRRRENVEIARKHAVSAAHLSNAWRGRASLFRAARNGFWPRRQFQPRFAFDTLQRS